MGEACNGSGYFMGGEGRGSGVLEFQVYGPNVSCTVLPNFARIILEDFSFITFNVHMTSDLTRI